jgi:hypothetical protein
MPRGAIGNFIGQFNEPMCVITMIFKLRTKALFDPSSTVPITKPLSIRGNPRRFSGLALHLR